MAKHDDKIKQLLKKVEIEKDKLGAKPKVNWNTNCMFRFDDQRYFNLNTVKDVNVLVEALAFLLEKQAMQQEACTRLGVESAKLEWKGYSVGDWEHDFKLKAQVIEWNRRQKKFLALQKQLDGLVSEEARTEMALDEIEKLLG